MAYNAKLDAQAAKFAAMYAQYYPSQSSWGDAIAVQRNLNNYDGQELLDLMRLAQRTERAAQRARLCRLHLRGRRRAACRAKRSGSLKAGIAAGLLKSNDVFVSRSQHDRRGPGHRPTRPTCRSSRAMPGAGRQRRQR